MEYQEAKSMEKRKMQQLLEHGYQTPVYLGQGAESQVWRVWNESLHAFAVCKICPADKQAERERILLKSLQHPVFPRYMEAWTGADCSFLVMEYIQGSTLREMICRRGRFAWKQAVHVGIELAEGLLFLHERSQPILFRDMKPDNVIIRQDGRVKLIDVGCACYEGEQLSMAGSRGYSAPEQFIPATALSVESDVYALGKLLVFMLTGQEEGLPDEGRDNKESNRMGRRKREKHIWKGVPYGLRSLVEKAARGERRERLPDMRSFLQQLAIYNGVHPLKRLCTDWRARIRHGEKEEFYYIQNVRRGM